MANDVVEVDGSSRYENLWACGRYRASAVRLTDRSVRGVSHRWEWRVWDVLDPELGGSGFKKRGIKQTQHGACDMALATLLKAARAGEVASGEA